MAVVFYHTSATQASEFQSCFQVIENRKIYGRALKKEVKLSSRRRCILILADGARSDVIWELMTRGMLPNIERFLAERGGFHEAVSAFPSVTGCAYLPIITGFTPGECNVPGMCWVDRRYLGVKSFHLDRYRDYFGVHSYLFNRDISPAVKTLFELADNPMNIFSFVSRGCDFKGDVTRYTRGLRWVWAHLSGRWDKVDLEAAQFALKGIEEGRDFIFLLMPSIDALSHRSSPLSDEVIQGYMRLDETVGKIARTTDPEETMIVLTSDHGLSETQVHFDLAEFLSRLGFKTLHSGRRWRLNPDMAIMPSGNAMAHIYVRPESGWSERCYYPELRRFGGHKVDLVELLLNIDAVDLVAAKVPSGGVIISSRLGEAYVELEGKMITYQILEGEDPFGYPPFPGEISDRKLLELSMNTDYPDAPYQILKLFTSPRSGDIILSASRGCELRAQSRRFIHNSGHGSLRREHILVPFLLNRPLTRTGPFRTADIFSIIVEFLIDKTP